MLVAVVGGRADATNASPNGGGAVSALFVLSVFG
jgi:hypothetical protein